MKRILAMVLALAMIVGIAPMAMAAETECKFGKDCPSKGYIDNPLDAWYHDYVDLLISEKIMIGTSATTFDPEQSMTRGMAATLFWRTLGSPKAKKAASFSDVKSDAWYADAVSYLAEIGLFQGMGNGIFAPDQMLTREQYAVVMYRLSGYIGWYHAEPNVNLANFKDGDQISSWAKEAMIWAISEGLIKGDDKGYLNCANPTKRCESAAIMVRLSDNAEDYIIPDAVVKNEVDLIAAMEKGGLIIIDKDVTVPADKVIEIKKDTIVELMADLDASASTSRPFSVAENTNLTINAGKNTVKMGKYGLINVPNSKGVNIELNGGTYVGKTDNGSFIKPRGEGDIKITLNDVNVVDASENGGWLLNGVGRTAGTVSVEIKGGSYEGYNGITGTEDLKVDGMKMTVVHNAINVNKTGAINNCTIKVLSEGTAKEQANAPSSAVSADNNGYVKVTNCTLESEKDVFAIYTTGGTIEAVNNTIVKGAISEYHPRDHYPDAEFLITVDGVIPGDLRFPYCEGKTPCADCIAIVDTEDELRAAVANGGKIALAGNIELDADATMTVASGKKVELNLNGNKIVGETDGTGNREMFLVKGEMTAYNGTITTEHTGADMVWNSMTTIFDVTDGGILNVKDANLENLGGTAMTFCVHLNNWGEVTLNAEDSSFKATYVAVRVFNSGFDMNNVSFTDCSLHGDKYAFWVHNYLNDLNATQHPEADVNARLNIDLTNGTNELTNGTAENPKSNPIRLGMSGSRYFDAQGNEIV